MSTESRFSLYHRVALYSQSLVNIFTPSGAATLSLFVRGSKTIICNFGAGGSDGDYRYYRREGTKPGHQLFRLLHGHVLWSKEKSSYTVNSLLDAFKELSALLTESVNFLKVFPFLYLLLPF